MNNLVYSYQYGNKELILKTNVATSKPVYIYFKIVNVSFSAQMIL